MYREGGFQNVARMNANPRDPNRGTTNAGSMRTNLCVFEGDMTASER